MLSASAAVALVSSVLLAALIVLGLSWLSTTTGTAAPEAVRHAAAQVIVPVARASTAVRSHAARPRHATSADVSSGTDAVPVPTTSTTATSGGSTSTATAQPTTRTTSGSVSSSTTTTRTGSTSGGSTSTNTVNAPSPSPSPSPTHGNGKGKANGAGNGAKPKKP